MFSFPCREDQTAVATYFPPGFLTQFYFPTTSQHVPRFSNSLSCQEKAHGSWTMPLLDVASCPACLRPRTAGDAGGQHRLHAGAMKAGNKSRRQRHGSVWSLKKSTNGTGLRHPGQVDIDWNEKIYEDLIRSEWGVGRHLMRLWVGMSQRKWLWVRLSGYQMDSLLRLQPITTELGQWTCLSLLFSIVAGDSNTRLGAATYKRAHVCHSKSSRSVKSLELNGSWNMLEYIATSCSGQTVGSLVGRHPFTNI